jgi:GAF domain-containing protein
MIASARLEIQPFTDKQIALLQNFAAQAVIAMENARLLTETREALEQQTATAEELGVINSSPGDLGPVFEAILDKAHKLCDAAVGALTTFDGTLCHTQAMHGFPAEHIAAISQPYRPDPVHLRMMAGEWIMHVPDVALLDVVHLHHEVMRRTIERVGARTLLAVVLRKDNAFLGCITAYRKMVRPFSEREVALLENFAAQAVIAMENARLLGELRARRPHGHHYPDLGRLPRHCRRASLVTPLGLGLGDTLPLSFQHHLALPGGDASQDRPHELAGGVAGVELAAHRQHDEPDAAQ